MSLDLTAHKIYHKSPAFFRAIMMAPVDKRPLMIALIGLDIELWTAANSSQEDMVNAIKLAWWKEALAKPSSGSAEHPTLMALREARVPVDLPLAMVNAYQGKRESLPIFVRAISEHLQIDPEKFVTLISEVAEKTYRPRRWSRAERPVVAMLVPMNIWQRLTLFLFRYV